LKQNVLVIPRIRADVRDADGYPQESRSVHQASLSLWIAQPEMSIYNADMDISVTEFKQRCLEILRQVEETGQAVTIRRRGKVVARIEPPAPSQARASLKPWERVRLMGGRLLAKPGESVFRDKDFEALR
jgi:antitoxin (DNA-binding transcriptional repressor) of toxin-antitoxin stability system